MNASRRKIATGATALTAVLTLLATPSAFAADRTDVSTAKAAAAASADERLATVKQAGVTAIDNRLTMLGNLQSRVNEASALTADHKSALSSKLSAQTSGLTALKTQIQGDAVLEQLRAHMALITRDYRVYVVTQPQVHLVRAADASSAATTKMQGAVTQLTNASKLLKAGGVDTTNIDKEITTAKNALDAATSSLNGQADKALALDPKSWPDNKATITAIREAVAKAAASDATAAAALTRAVEAIDGLD